MRESNKDRLLTAAENIDNGFETWSCNAIALIPGDSMKRPRLYMDDRGNLRIVYSNGTYEYYSDFAQDWKISYFYSARADKVITDFLVCGDEFLGVI